VVSEDPDLAAIRARIDALDRQLVKVLAARAKEIEAVIRFKRSQNLLVVDLAREASMLSAIEVQARTAGLDPGVARSVLQCVIAAFTRVEEEDLHPHD
jgi:chorismate mutase